MTSLHLDLQVGDKFFDALADLIAAKLRIATCAADGYYDGSNSPLGRRRFLLLARRGAFPSSKVGRRVLARRDHVDRYIAGCARACPTATDDIGTILDRAGIRSQSSR